MTLKDNAFVYMFVHCVVLGILAVPLTVFAISFAIFHKDKAQAQPAETQNPPQDKK